MIHLLMNILHEFNLGTLFSQGNCELILNQDDIKEMMFSITI